MLRSRLPLGNVTRDNPARVFPLSLIALLLVFCANLHAAAPSSGSWYHWQLLTPNKQPIDVATAVARWDDKNVILVGEWHTHSGIHQFQAALLNQLMWHSSTIALSMEQFSRDQQATLDAYLAGKVGEHAVIDIAWSNYPSDYRPLVEQMKQAQRPVIAANAPSSIVRCVSAEGATFLATLPHSHQLWVAPELNLDDPAYRAKFEAATPHGDVPSDNQFAAQVTWDETMADSILFYLATYPDTQIVHLAGAFHVENGLGIESRLLRREPNLKTVLITPISAAELELYQPNNNEYLLLASPIPAFYLEDEAPTFAHHHRAKCQLSEVPSHN
uniref:ChaN family lipoprotein n=1 Tax=Thaumasiovibrio occultus TaxID=1891184 RepID=UPI000B363F88|nr:ChaN family lipoprotein [Thaumasiovibrio occultus]